MSVPPNPNRASSRASWAPSESPSTSPRLHHAASSSLAQQPASIQPSAPAPRTSHKKSGLFNFLRNATHSTAYHPERSEPASPPSFPRATASLHRTSIEGGPGSVRSLPMSHGSPSTRRPSRGDLSRSSPPPPVTSRSGTPIARPAPIEASGSRSHLRPRSFHQGDPQSPDLDRYSYASTSSSPPPNWGNAGTWSSLPPGTGPASANDAGSWSRSRVAPTVQVDREPSEYAASTYSDQEQEEGERRKSSKRHILPLLRHGRSVRRRTRQRVKDTFTRSHSHDRLMPDSASASHESSLPLSARGYQRSQYGSIGSASTAMNDPNEEHIRLTPITSALTASSSNSSLSAIPLPSGSRTPTAVSAPTEAPPTTQPQEDGTSRRKFHLHGLFHRHRSRPITSGATDSRKAGGSNTALAQQKLRHVPSTPSLHPSSHSTRNSSRSAVPPKAAQQAAAQFAASIGLTMSVGLDAELDQTTEGHTPNALANWSWNNPSPNLSNPKLDPTAALTPRISLPTATEGPTVTRPIPVLTEDGPPLSPTDTRYSQPAISGPSSSTVQADSVPTTQPPTKPRLGRIRSNSDTRPPKARLGSNQRSPDSSISPLSSAAHLDLARVPYLRRPTDASDNQHYFTASPVTTPHPTVRVPSWPHPPSLSLPPDSAPLRGAADLSVSVSPESTRLSVAVPPGGPHDPSGASRTDAHSGPSTSLPGRAPSSWSVPESWAVETVRPPGVTTVGSQPGSEPRPWMAPPSWEVDFPGSSATMFDPGSNSSQEDFATPGADNTPQVRASSTWMAPDSWAVQEPRARDSHDSEEEEGRGLFDGYAGLRLGEDSDQDEELSSAPLAPVRSRTADPMDPSVRSVRPRRSGSSGRDTLASLPLRQAVGKRIGRSQSHERLRHESSSAGADGSKLFAPRSRTGMESLRSTTPTPPLPRSSTPNSFPSNESGSNQHRPSNATVYSTRSDWDSADSVEEMADTHNRHGSVPALYRSRRRVESPPGNHSPESSAFSLFRRRDDSLGAAQSELALNERKPSIAESTRHSHHLHKVRPTPRYSNPRGGGGALAAASGAVGTAASILGLRANSPRVTGFGRYQAAHHHRDREKERTERERSLGDTTVPGPSSGFTSAPAVVRPHTPASQVHRSLLPTGSVSSGATLHALAGMGLGGSMGLGGMNEHMLAAPGQHPHMVSYPNTSFIGHRDTAPSTSAASIRSGQSIMGGSATLGGLPLSSLGNSDEEDHLSLYRHVVQTKEPARRLTRGSSASSAPADGYNAWLTQRAPPNLNLVRIYRQDGTFTTLRLTLANTTVECRAIISRKVSFMSATNSAFRLFVRDKGAERPLGPNEKPAQIQRRRLIQAGYNELDGLEDMGKEDLSYFIKFIYRPDIVPGLDSESFGNDPNSYAHLDLQGRNLEMVPIFLYKHADWIKSLDLSGNPISDIPADFVQMCSSLRSLGLTNLALKRIPPGVRVSRSLTHLDVSNNRILQLEPSLEECISLRSIKAQNNRLYQLPNWMPQVSTLTSLNLSNNRFDLFPPVVTELRNLAELDLSFNSISKLPPEIAQLQKLEKLILVGNSLEDLPEQMADLGNLHTIDVRRNWMHDVSILFRMPRVNEVKCEHNAIRHFEATLGEKMRVLEVGLNPMTKVSIDVVTASDLTHLNLSSTNMARLDEGMFKLLPSLTSLILDRNQLVTLPESLGELSNLVIFSCNNNSLVTLPDSLGNLRKLNRLNVQNNNLKRLPASIWKCASLYRLNVTSNLLEALPTPPLLPPSAMTTPQTAYAGLLAPPDSLVAGDSATPSTSDSDRKGSIGSVPGSVGTPDTRPPMAKSLRQLRVADNHLADDVFTILKLFTDLEVLNLSFNEIYEVPPHTLAQHTKLQELFLSGNSLTSVPEDLFELQDLRVLFLNGNKLQTLPAELKHLTALVELDVGNNNLKYNIANWGYDWNWNNNPELRYLNLSGNQRFEIKSKVIELEGGRRKNISDFNDLHSVRVLGLMDVTVAANSTPDELIGRRVRTSLSKVNEMSYGISDALGVGERDSLSTVDVVVPMFRKAESEALLAMFDARGQVPVEGSKIARFMAEGIAVQFEKQLAIRANQSDGVECSVEDCLRRTFLQLNSLFVELMMNEYNRRPSGTRTLDTIADRLPINRSGVANTPEWSQGCSAVVIYVMDHTLYVANAGDSLAVLSHNGGQAELIATKHEPFDRDETQRIRTAEGWVSLDGRVNSELDVSRGFGYYHLFPVVNAAPAVHKIRLTDSDEFVIIANHSLWDFLSYQTAVDIARMERDDPMVAAERLRDLAISYGGADSIMVMILSVADLFGTRNGLPLNSQVVDVMRRQRYAGATLPADRTLARLEREVPPPVGQIALVFSDIKSSTHLWETISGMHTAMRIHNTLLRRQLRSVAGFESKVEGDGMMASFSSVSAALLWCFNVQIGLLHEDWPQELLDSEEGREIRDQHGNIIYRGLRLRMGIHWGSPVCEPDPITGRMDYFGPMVNRASRISSAADGGQIFVSKDAVQELTATIGAFDSSNQIRAREGDDDTSIANVSRDVILLRRMGFGITEIGFRRLKGLETPELLNLVYPQALHGRLEDDRTLQMTAHPAQVFEPTVQLLDAGQVRQIGLICLRVEALSAGHPFPGIMDSHLDAAQTTSSGTVLRPNNQSRMSYVEGFVLDKPELLVCMARDDASDEELAVLLVQLTVRLANAVAKMTLDMIVRSMPRAMSPVPQPTNTQVQSLSSDPRLPASTTQPTIVEPTTSDALGLSLNELQQLVSHLQGLTSLLPTGPASA